MLETSKTTRWRRRSWGRPMSTTSAPHSGGCLKQPAEQTSEAGGPALLGLNERGRFGQPDSINPARPRPISPEAVAHRSHSLPLRTGQVNSPRLGKCRTRDERQSLAPPRRYLAAVWLADPKRVPLRAASGFAPACDVPTSSTYRVLPTEHPDGDLRDARDAEQPERLRSVGTQSIVDTHNRSAQRDGPHDPPPTQGVLTDASRGMAHG